jgi:hypothetical protein
MVDRSISGFLFATKRRLTGVAFRVASALAITLSTSLILVGLVGRTPRED